MILGTFGNILANLTLDQWIKLAPAAVEFVSAAVKLGETIEPAIRKHEDEIQSRSPRARQNGTPALTAHQQWITAWTEADQRAADFQDGAR